MPGLRWSISKLICTGLLCATCPASASHIYSSVRSLLRLPAKTASKPINPVSPTAAASPLPSSRLINDRQQEAIPANCGVPPTVYFKHATCFPFIGDSPGLVCDVSTSATVACGVAGSTTTVTDHGRTITGRCGQTGCPGCLPSDVAIPHTSAVVCRDCTTINGTVIKSQATELTSTYTSGAMPPAITGRAAEKTFEDFSLGLSHKEDRPLVSAGTISNTTIDKRTLMVASDYPGGHDEFMCQQVAQAVMERLLVPHRPWGTDGRSSAKVRNFQGPGGNLAVQGLNGCTSVAIVSRRGAWLSHLWELPSFRDDALFVPDVLDGIFEGDRSGWFPGISVFSREISLFNTHTYGETQNVVQPIIITPKLEGFWGDPDRPWRFIDHVQRIKDRLQTTFGVVPIVYTYDMLETLVEGITYAEILTKMATTAHGKVVIQYDPRQYLPVEPVLDSEGNVHSHCVKQYAMVRVYANTDDKPIYEDTWLAMPQQAMLADDGIITQQVSKREEHGTISWYGCIAASNTTTKSTETCLSCTSSETCSLDPEAGQGEDGDPKTTITCTTCISNSTCLLDPDDDQGEDGTLQTTGSCTMCTSNSTCTLDPGDDQGQDGIDPPWCNGTFSSNGTADSHCSSISMNSSTTASTTAFAPPLHGSNCSMTVMPATTITASATTVTYAEATSCRCNGGELTALTTMKASNAWTIGCARLSTMVPLSTNMNGTGTGAANCSLWTEPSATINATSVIPGSTKCNCGPAITGAITTTTRENGDRIAYCQGSGGQVPITTGAGSPSITSCTVTSVRAKAMDGSPYFSDFCSCNNNQTLAVTVVTDTNFYSTILCTGNSTTFTPVWPPITSCEITSTSARALDGSPYSSLICSCNGDQTLSVSTLIDSNSNSTLVCSGNSTSFTPASVSASTTTTESSASVTFCQLVANTAAITSRTITKSAELFPEPTKCFCDGRTIGDASKITTVNGRTQYVCPNGATWEAQTQVTTCKVVTNPVTTVLPITKAEEVVCTCNGGVQAAINTVTASDGVLLYECLVSASSKIVVGSTKTAAPAPTPTTATGICQVHVQEWVDPRDRDNWHLHINASLYDWNMKQAWQQFFRDKFDSIYVFAHSTGPNMSLTYDLSMRFNVTRGELPPGNNRFAAPPRPPNLFTKYDKEIMIGIEGETHSFFSTADSGMPYCKVGDWDIVEPIEFLDPKKHEVRSSQQFDCWFECRMAYEDSAWAAHPVPQVPSKEPSTPTSQTTMNADDGFIGLTATR